MTSFPGVPTSMTLNDLEPQKYGFLVNFSRFQAGIHILRVMAPKTFEIDQDNLRMKFSALKIDFNGVRLDPLGSRSP